MKKRNNILEKTTVVIAALIMVFSFVTCVTEAPPQTTAPQQAQQVPPQAPAVRPSAVEPPPKAPSLEDFSTLAEKLRWLSTNAQSGETYTLEVAADETLPSQTLSYSGKSNITIILKGIGSARTLSFNGNGSLFDVRNGVTLVLDENITLKGNASNTASTYNGLVRVFEGTFIMNDGSKIIGNNGSGVFVIRGSFTMNGGEISGNTPDSGGGVHVNFRATFDMYGGIISGNTPGRAGGGVAVSPGGIFTMYDGEISGNNGFGISIGQIDLGPESPSAIMNGGKINNNSSTGVRIFVGSFTMNGGEISGNTASSGAGVYVSSITMNGETYNGTFSMNGGTISGNTASSGGGGVMVFSGTFSMSGGTISGNTGGGVVVSILIYDDSGTVVGGTFRISNGIIYGSNEPNVNLRNTATNGAALSVATGYSATAQRGTFSGDTWVRSGDLSTTNNTIRVVNGNIQ
jgi:hypothetical protein